jgi:hypothetical protein
MTRKADEAAAERDGMSGLEKVIHDYIYGLPAAERLYPDLYAEKLAEKVREYGEKQD